RSAVVHGHCHHKALLHFEKETALLKDTGLSCTVLDSGCCGMAGAFGYEKEHYALGRKCGERVLLPAVRSADKDALIISDGFSCREQIRQETDRQALHLAEVLELALHQGPAGPPGALPERHALAKERPQPPPFERALFAGAILAVAALFGSVLSK